MPLARDPALADYAQLRQEQYAPDASNLTDGSSPGAVILSALSALTYREREIIKLRYGIGDSYTYTLEEVGRRFKVSRERVRQIEAKALRHLKTRLHDNGVIL